MTASPYLLRTADPIATGQNIPLDVRKGVGGTRIELGVHNAIPSGLFAQRLTAVVDTSGVQLMTTTRRDSAEPDPGLTERLVAAISTAVHNGFPVDPTVLKRVLNLAGAIEKYVPQLVPSAALNLGPSGSFEFLISLPRTIVEVTAERGEEGFDVYIERRADGAVEESHCAEPVQIVKLVAAAVR